MLGAFFCRNKPAVYISLVSASFIYKQTIEFNLINVQDGLVHIDRFYRGFDHADLDQHLRARYLLRC